MFEENRRLIFGITAGVVVFSIVLGIQGCQQYGNVSPRAYEIATALYSVCNRQDTERLTAVEDLLSEGLEAEQLSSAEHDWLQDIVSDARAGDWQDSMNNARTMLSEQVSN